MAGADVTSAAAGAQCPRSEAVVSIHAGPRLRGVAVVSGGTQQARTTTIKLVDVMDTLRRDKSSGVVLPSAPVRLVGRANCHACFLPPPRRRPRKGSKDELLLFVAPRESVDVDLAAFDRLEIKDKVAPDHEDERGRTPPPTVTGGEGGLVLVHGRRQE